MVLSCVVRWIEGGLKAQVTHRVQEYDEGNEKIGSEMEIDLSTFKYFTSPVQVFDKETMSRWRERKQYHENLTAISEKAKADQEKLENALHQYKKQMEKSFLQKKNRAIANFEATAKQTAETKANANTSAMKKVLKELLQEIVVDVRKGLLKLDEESTLSKNAQLKQFAKERFAQNWLVDQRRKLDVKLAEEAVELNQRLQQRQQEVKELQQKIQDKADRNTMELTEAMRQKTMRRKKHLLTKAKFDPAVFKRAVSNAANCEHLKTKAWGDKYSKGVKCTICGKELSQLEKEDSQLEGFGSGADPWMVDALKRHRQNEASFRFKKSEEIAAVEAERRRLEKERREMEESEAYFYDFQDLKIIYDFDQRHAKTIKQAGVFRQVRLVLLTP